MFKLRIMHNAIRTTNLALALSCCVMILGAFTRLSDAGLGCPDWPGCYGRLIAPTSAILPHIEPSKAWIEMIHRYAAGILGCLILFNFILHIKQRTKLHTTLFAAIFLLALVIFQALLGMWTVTLRLYPVVVLAHLLGGMAILSMLWWQKLSLEKLVIPKVKQYYYTSNKLINFVCNLSILVIIIQLGLGAWTSSNYAAIVCADFPSCQGCLWPTMDFKAAFALFNVGIFDSPGTPLENTARVTIQMSHRIGALVSFILLSYLSWLLFTLKYNPSARRLAIILFFVLCVQISLGITNILAALPMPVALLHNAGGALLLLTLIKIKHAKIIA